MIYEYDRKNKIVKIDDRTVYLTPSQAKIFELYQERGYISLIDVDCIVYRGLISTKTMQKNFIKELSVKLGMEIKVK